MNIVVVCLFFGVVAVSATDEDRLESLIRRLETLSHKRNRYQLKQNDVRNEEIESGEVGESEQFERKAANLGESDEVGENEQFERKAANLGESDEVGENTQFDRKAVNLGESGEVGKSDQLVRKTVNNGHSRLYNELRNYYNLRQSQPDDSNSANNSTTKGSPPTNTTKETNRTGNKTSTSTTMPNTPKPHSTPGPHPGTLKPNSSSGPHPTSHPGTLRPNSTTPLSTPGPYYTTKSPNITHISDTDWLDLEREYEDYRCPSLRLVLFDMFKEFPRNIQNMSWSPAIQVNDFAPIFDRSVDVYKNLQDNRLALNYMNKEIASLVVSRLMMCPSTQFVHANSYILLKRFVMALDDSRPDSLFNTLSRTMALLNEPQSKFLSHSISTIRRKVIGHLTEEIQSGLFYHLGHILRNVYFSVSRFYLAYKSFPGENELSHIFNNSIAGHEQAFSCTPAPEVVDIQIKAIEDMRKRLLLNGQSDWMDDDFIKDNIEELFREHFPDEHSSDYYVTAVTKHIKQYTQNITDRVEQLIQHVKTADTAWTSTMFGDTLDSQQVQTLMEIIIELRKQTGDRPDWIRQIRDVLRRLKAYQNNPYVGMHKLHDIIKQLENVLKKYDGH